MTYHKIKAGMAGSRCGKGRRDPTAVLKRESKKARRAEGKKATRDWSAEKATATAPTGPITFRLVITTQVYENYGSHAWDGKGECPQYWKAKGGNEYQWNLGTANDVIGLGRDGCERLVLSLAPHYHQLSDFWHEYLIDWRIVPSNEETFEEQQIREMHEWGMIDEATRDRYLSDLRINDAA